MGEELSTVTDSQQRSFGQELNTWVATMGIVAAAMWGAYTFIYKEIMIPRSAPVNISVDLQLKKVGTCGLNEKQEESLIAVEMKISATNPSSREVHLFTSGWIAYGIKISPRYTPDSMCCQSAVTLVNSRQGGFTEKYSSRTPQSVVAAGNIFGDSFLKPNEKITRTLVFHVPRDIYDSIEVYAYMPTAARASDVVLEWHLDDSGSWGWSLYRVGKNAERTPLKKGKSGEYSDAPPEFQWASQISELSLWQ